MPYADITQPPRALPAANVQVLQPGISLQHPLTRLGKGPGLILLTTTELYDESLMQRDDAPTAMLKWAEEGYTVFQVSAAAVQPSDIEAVLSQAVNTFDQCDSCQPKEKFGIVCYSKELWNVAISALTKCPRVVAAVVYTDGDKIFGEDRHIPLLKHVAGLPQEHLALLGKRSVKEYYYPKVKGQWFSAGNNDFDYSTDSVAHTRSLQFLKPQMDGPYFDLEEIWDEHTYYEFADRSVEHTMSTMVQEPYVNHIPTVTGGVGRSNLSSFYKNNFIFNNSADTELELVSRTVGIDRVIDEFIFKFTHDRELDWLLPGVPPTNLKAEVPFIAVVNIRGDRLYHEHISWDQGTTLRQLGLLPDYLPFPHPLAGEKALPNGTRAEYRVPVLGIETADKLRDRKSVPSNEMFKRVVAGRIGPSKFSDNISNETMLEIETPELTESSMDITIDQKLHFLQGYLSVTESFIDIFDSHELEAYMGNSDEVPGVTETDANLSNRDSSALKQPSQLHRASLDLVLAIGAQCTSKEDSQNIARALFQRAQRQALSEMIQNPELDMVRAYILMGFYMLGECRRNTAYMYFSVAARAGIALGLHSPSSYPKHKHMDANDNLRLRVWMTCRLCDKLVNSLLGRPGTTVGIIEELNPIFANLSSSDDHNSKCLVAAYKIVSIIDEINTQLYGEQDIRISVIKRILQSIEYWKCETLPSLEVKGPESISTSGKTTADNTKASMGTVHVSCLYYFAVMLVTRPVFISDFTLRPGDSDQSSPMSEACLEAATYLAQTCAEALDTDVLESNMCIMKALIFAAGLVLGVESFSKLDVKVETEHAFEAAKRVLAFLATRSPQASHYLDILSSLSNAITEQRLRTRMIRTNRYVSRLFPTGDLSISSAEAVDGQLHDNHSEMSGISAEAPEQTTRDDPLYTESPSTWANYEQIDPELFIDWESVNICNWDNFPFLM
ncbi:Filamentous growth regulator [Acrodontium crateriforme]|uniref:Filamentous growth regulator n=1 Tax=Acrodontium crateriforme TaxID=150365 RepID=A0AAQ3MCB1_9PEZI|nr:Filamentous growth regulator [Acrodontium crateriforme]